jgi:hypothetical protein
MKKQLSILSVVLSLFCFVGISNAQEESPLDISLDVASRYVWRGLDFGNSPSIQPGIEFSKWGLSLGAWGAYTSNINAPAQEMDIYIGYTFLNDMISITFTDYFFPTDGAVNNYFDYKADATGHVFEASLSFNGTENLPLYALVGTNFYGADALHYSGDANDPDGNIMFSTYAEIGYSLDVKGIGLDLFCGANLIGASNDDIDNGYSGFYNDKLGIINLGFSLSKDLNISESFSIPFSVAFITNPLNENVFLVASMSF